MAIETEFGELNREERVAARSRTAARSALRTDSVYLVACYAIMVIAVVIALVPFFFAVSTSFRQTISLFKYPPEWLPHEPTLRNYRKLINDYPFERWVLNSLFVASVVTVIKVVFDSMAGYAFAKMRFPGRDALFIVVLMSLMIPFAATLLPLFIIVREFHFTNTYWGLILPPLANPIGVFMMRQFIESLPNDLENAARLDGCSEFQTYRRVILPLIKPGLVVLAVFTFMNQWTSYLWPLVVATRKEMQTLTVGVQSLYTMFTIDWGVISAAAVLAMLPMILVFIFLQRYFIAGSIAGALKE